MSVQSLIEAHGVAVGIYRPAFTVDASGYSVPTFTVIGTARAFVQLRSGAEAQTWNAERGSDQVEVYFDAGTSVNSSDIIQYGSRKFRVLSVRKPGEFPPSEFAAHVQATCVEWQGDITS